MFDDGHRGKKVKPPHAVEHVLASRIYEVAGVSHIPQPVQDVAWLGAFRQNPTDARPFVRAAIHHRHDWISKGKNPPASVYVDGQRTTSGWLVSTDAMFFPSGNLAPAFGGTYPPFSDEELTRRYPTEDVYLDLVTRAADQLLQDGYILQEERDLCIIEASGDPGKQGRP